MAFCHTAPGSKPLQRRTPAEASLAPVPAAVALGHASLPVHTCKSREATIEALPADTGDTGPQSIQMFLSQPSHELAVTPTSAPGVSVTVGS